MVKKIQLTAAPLEKQWDVRFPERLRRFYDDDEWKIYESRLVTDLAHFGSDTKERISFADREYLPGKFEYSKGYPGRDRSLFPLCELPAMDGSYFMAADLADESIPVLFFDYEEGFHSHSDSLDDFLASLLKPGEKTRAEQLNELTKEAKDLYDAEKYAEARDMLEAGCSRLARVIKFDLFDQLRHLPGASRNLLGLCYKALEDFDRALTVFESAVEIDRDRSAALNVLSIYLFHRKDYPRVIEYGEKVGRELLFNFYDYPAFYQRLYLGRARIMLGEKDGGALEFALILSRFAEKDVEKIENATEALTEIRDAGGAAGDIAGEILQWFGPPRFHLDAASIAANREWWDALPKGDLRNEFQELMGKKKPGDEDLARLLRRTTLELQHDTIKDLTWIEKFPRLRTLNLEGNQVADIAPLARLRHLNDLDLRNNPIKDFSPLANLTRLTKIDLAETGLRDLEPLKELHELRKIRVCDNKIKSVEALRALPELREVTLYNNLISDLEPLSESILLKEISCFGNPLEKPDQNRGLAGALAIKDLPMLQEMDAHIQKISEEEVATWRAARPWTVAPGAEELDEWVAWWQQLDPNLRGALLEEIDDDEVKDGVPTAEGFLELRQEDYLSLSKQGLSDISPLTRLDRLDHLTLNKNKITRLPDLRSFACLRTLDLNANRVHDFAPLADVPHLAALDLAGNEIENIASLPVMTSLRKLGLEKNQIVDLGPLGAQVGLRVLYLEGNRIRDVQPLAALKQVRKLWIQENKIVDLSPLDECDNLEELVCFANPGLRGLMALKDLVHLYRVRAHGAFAAEEVAEFRRLRPDVDVL
jgi:Leucine-rich repeat (LRR) protein